MNWYKVFYWMSVADSTVTILGIMAILTFLTTIVCTIGYFFSNVELSDAATSGGPEKQSTTYNEWLVWVKAWKRVLTLSIIICSLSSILWALIPSKKDMMLIIAGGAVGNFITSDSSSKAIPADLTRYLHLKLNAELEDLGSDTRKQLGIQTKKDELIDKFKDFSKEQVIDYLKKDTTFIK